MSTIKVSLIQLILTVAQTSTWDISACGKRCSASFRRQRYWHWGPCSSWRLRRGLASNMGLCEGYTLNPKPKPLTLNPKWKSDSWSLLRAPTQISKLIALAQWVQGFGTTPLHTNTHPPPWYKYMYVYIYIYIYLNRGTPIYDHPYYGDPHKGTPLKGIYVFPEGCPGGGELYSGIVPLSRWNLALGIL